MRASTEPEPYRLLVYGADAKGLQIPKGDLASRRYTIAFAKGKDAARFQDFDGVIVFQGSFESFERTSDGYRSHLSHRWDRDELDKRTKEALSVIDKGGFACLLLTDPFIDRDERRDFRETDLSKRLLSRFGVDRDRFRTRLPHVGSKVNELAKFFTLYGAAWSSLSPRDPKEPFKTLASVGRASVSVVVDGSLFAIPTLLPNSTDEALEEYFTILADGVVSLWERLKVDLPEWAAEYRFPGETKRLEAKFKLLNEISRIEEQLNVFERLKRVLVLQGEPLVDAVAEVFDKLLPLKPKREEAFREDLMLLDATGKGVALVEIKGVSRGVSREHVNQADSHRERNGMPPEFPSLLIVNTNMKTSASVADKDQLVAAEQIQHAAKNNVLVLRTLDLLNLASLYASGRLSSEDTVELLTNSRGWLKVGADKAEVLAG